MVLPLLILEADAPVYMAISSRLNDTTTWWQPDEEMEVEDPRLGRLRLRVWHSLHLRQAAQQTVSLIQLQRLEPDSPLTPKPLWLIWAGLEFASLHTVWPQYLRRFAIDHWYRFAKQRLHWTLPQLSTPEQSRALERLDASAHLAALVSPLRGARLPTALAKTIP